jgi:hypothetical protein
VGSLFTGTFSAWFGTAGAMLPLLTFVALPSAYAAYRFSRSMSLFHPSLSALLWFLVIFLSQPPLMVIPVRAAMRHAARSPVELGDLLGEAWRTYLPVLVIEIILALAWGTMPLVDRMLPWVPGARLVLVPALLFLFTVWTVSVPALVAERVGPVVALVRSWELTRGHRWRIFGAFVLISICVGVVALGVYFGLIYALVKAYGPLDRIESRSLLAWAIAAYVVIVTSAGSVLSTATGVAYQLLTGRTDETELRRVFA